MGFFDRLFGGRFTMPPPDETNASHAAIMREFRTPESKARKQALATLTETLLSAAPEPERARLVRRVLRKYAVDQDATSALTDGLLDPSRGQKLAYLALLNVDWRGFDGFQYLAPHLASASGVQNPTPTCTPAHDRCKPCWTAMTNGSPASASALCIWTPAVTNTSGLSWMHSASKPPLSWHNKQV